MMRYNDDSNSSWRVDELVRTADPMLTLRQVMQKPVSLRRVNTGGVYHGYWEGGQLRLALFFVDRSFSQTPGN